MVTTPAPAKFIRVMPGEIRAWLENTDQVKVARTLNDFSWCTKCFCFAVIYEVGPDQLICRNCGDVR